MSNFFIYCSQQCNFAKFKFKSISDDIFTQCEKVNDKDPQQPPWVGPEGHKKNKKSILAVCILTSGFCQILHNVDDMFSLI